MEGERWREGFGPPKNFGVARGPLCFTIYLVNKVSYYIGYKTNNIIRLSAYLVVPGTHLVLVLRYHPALPQVHSDLGILHSH